MNNSNTSQSVNSNNNVSNNIVLSKVFANVKWIFFITIIQKIISFGLNQLLLWITTPEILGKASIQFELYLSSILFLSREGIRLALLRENISIDKTDFSIIKRQQLVNLSWIPSCIIIIIILYLCIFQSNNVDLYILLMYSFGALLESFGEPWVNLNLQESNLSPKLYAEVAGIMTKSIVTCLCLGILNLDVYSFAIAQICYGFSYTIILAISSPFVKMRYCFPRFNNNHPFINLASFQMAIITTISSILKYLLTEADKIAMTFYSSNYDKGIFSVANNYGSLFARSIYLPLEDTSRIAFSKLCLSNSHENKKESLILFIRLLRFITFIGGIIIIFGPSNVRLLVNLVFSSQWRTSEMVASLQVYCIYLYILGINGITEAFVQATAHLRGFRNANIGYVISSITFISFVMQFIEVYGTKAVILANSLSMGIRILFSYIYIAEYFEISILKILMKTILPQSILELLLICFTGIILYFLSISYSQSLMYFTDSMIHILLVGCIGLIYVVVMILYCWSKEDRHYVLQFVSRKGISKDE